MTKAANEGGLINDRTRKAAGLILRAPFTYL
jgi:hypothetical protein